MRKAKARAQITPQTPGWRDPSTAYGARAGKRSVGAFLLSFIVPPKYYRLRPTASGMILIVVMMALGGAAYNTASNILFMCLSLMMACLVMSGMFSFINFRNLYWKFEAPKILRAHETALGRIWIENRKKRIPVFILWFHVRAEKKGKRSRVVMSERLDAQRKTAINWHIPALPRGLRTLWISGVESQYPFGFLRKNIGVPIETEVVVWPKRLEYRIATGSGRRVFSGVGKSRLIGEGSDLSGLRVYRMGDDLRRVHWKASARSNEMLLKEFNEENVTGFRIWFQTSKALWSNEDAFERACALAGSVAEDLFKRGELLSLKIDDKDPMNGSSSSDFHVIMSALSQVQWREGMSLVSDENTHASEISFKPGEDAVIHILFGKDHVGSTI